MAKKLNAAQRRYIENALLIAALGLAFKKLEEDYKTKPLGEIAETTSGGTPLRNMSMYYGGNIPWIKSGELNDNLIESAEEYITEEGLANSSAKIYPKGTLVVALYGATVGKTGILGLDAASNQAVCAVSPKTKEITNEFIFWFLRHKRPEFLSMSFGGAQPNISQKIIRETQIPIPPLQLQKTLSDFFALIEKRQSGNTNNKYPTLPDAFANVLRIVTLIESLAARVNEAQRLRGEADSETEKYFASVTNQLFTELSEKYSPIAIGKTFTFRQDLIRPIDGKSGKIRFIGLQHVESNTGRRIGEDALYAEQLTGRKFHFSPGEIVYGYLRPYLNKVWIADCEGVCSVDQYVIRPTEKIVETKYLAYFMRSPVFLHKAIEMTHNLLLPRLRTGLLESILIPVPPLDEQRRIVTYLDGLQAKVNALRELQFKGGEELSALMPSILDKAFKGEL